METKKIPISEVPQNVKHVLKEAILDMEQALKSTAHEGLRTYTDSNIKKFKIFLGMNEWDIFVVVELASYFSRTVKNINLYSNHPATKEIIKEYEAVLNYINSQFDITYQDGEMMMVSEPIEELKKRIKKKE